MRTPTQKQWETVIDKLYSVLPFALQEDARLDMSEGYVNRRGHQCGTVHCVGGWYAIAHWQDAALDGSVPLDFRNGAGKLAEDLGFESRSDLTDWANDNWRLWGNGNGRDMFHSRLAYGQSDDVAQDLADVIRHFEFVADNCKKVKR